VVRLFYSITIVAISCAFLSGCNSEDTETPTSQNNSTGTSGQNGSNGTNGRNGTNGADCFDAPGITDRNGDGQIGVADCVGPAGPQGVQGPAGPSGDAGTNFKLLAKGSNFTRAAEHTFMPGSVVQTWLNNTSAYNNNNQHIDIVESGWPTQEPNEILFVVRNLHQEFCAGGSATNGGNTPADFNRTTGTVGTAFCTDHRVTPGTNGEALPSNVGITGARNYWIRLKLNGSPMMNCYGQSDIGRQVPGSPGVLGLKDYWKVSCHYMKGTGGDWNGSLTSLVVQEVSRSGLSSWDWEIYYR